MATTVAFLTASLFAAIALPAIEVAKGALDLKGFLNLALICYFFTLGVTVIIGLPAYLLLNRFHLVTWWSAMLAGLFSGLVTVFIVKSLSLSTIPVGGLSALVFWIIWRSGKPA